MSDLQTLAGGAVEVPVARVRSKLGISLKTIRIGFAFARGSEGRRIAAALELRTLGSACLLPGS
jgi:hypothetical protein